MDAGRIAALERDVDNLKSWQKSQNGSIRRVEDKVEKLQYWIMGQMAALLLLAFSIWLKG